MGKSARGNRFFRTKVYRDGSRLGAKSNPHSVWQTDARPGWHPPGSTPASFYEFWGIKKAASAAALIFSLYFILASVAAVRTAPVNSRSLDRGARCEKRIVLLRSG